MSRPRLSSTAKLCTERGLWHASRMLDPALKVPRRQTKLTWQEAQALIAACAPELSAHGLRKALAQSFFETGDFTCCWNYNWGNVRPSKGESYYTCRATEYEDGKLVVHENSPFQAYNSHEEGCRDWIKVLRSFPVAWAALVDDSKDAYDWGMALSVPVPGRGKYYTDIPEHYSAKVLEKWKMLWLAERGLRLIKSGARGSLVSRWQDICGAPKTGVFDVQTCIATRAWQKENGLKGDAVVGFDTWSEALSHE